MGLDAVGDVLNSGERAIIGQERELRLRKAFLHAMRKELDQRRH